MNDNQGTPPLADQPKKNNRTIIIVVAALVVVCCCCIVAGVLAWNYGDMVMYELGF